MGGVIKYGYDSYGDLVTVTDQLGNVTQFTYDSDHLLLEVYDPLGRRGRATSTIPAGASSPPSTPKGTASITQTTSACARRSRLTRSAIRPS